MLKINLVEEDVRDQPKYRVDNGKHTAVLRLHHFEKEYVPYLVKVIWEDGKEVTITASQEVLKHIKGLLVKREAPMDIIWCLLQYEYKTLDKLENRVEKLQNASLHEYSRKILTDVLKIKKTLFVIHRDYIRMRNTLEWLSQEEDVRPLLRDINELIYAIEYLIDGTTVAIQLMQNTLSVKMNEVIKILTIIATIMMPLTLITGIYGMNFVNMPEIKWQYGYYYSLVLMLVVALFMLYYFKRKKLL